MHAFTQSNALPLSLQGLSALVLDVKVGEAAFMKTVEEARELARAMADVGKGLGVKTSAVLTEVSHDLPPPSIYC
jgi:thymidine phosphorylase